MRFAFLIFKYFPFGGVQRDMLRIANDCAASGHEVTIYTGEWRGDKPANTNLAGSIKVVLLKSSGLFNHQRHQSLIKAMANEVLLAKPDLVVGFNRMPGLDAYYAADPCFVERAHAERGWWYRLSGRYRFFAASEKAVMSTDTHCQVLLLTSHDQAVFQHWYGTQDHRFHVLPPSIPAQRFANIDRASARHHLRQEFGLQQDADVMLMVGSAFVRKGLDRAIVALAQLPEAIRNNTWLLAVGEDEAEPMIAIARQHGVADRVFIVAEGRADVPDLMMGADVLVHAARSELAGIVIIEALTAGLPVIVTGVCGYAGHVSDAGAGKVLPAPYEQADFNQALAEMLSSPNREQWHAAGLRYTANILANTSATVEADLLTQFANDKNATSNATATRTNSKKG
ncbi:MAG: glycosyltransferase family 4 protein [Methylophilaceae bacterium]